MQWVKYGEAAGFFILKDVRFNLEGEKPAEEQRLKYCDLQKSKKLRSDVIKKVT